MRRSDPDVSAASLSEGVFGMLASSLNVRVLGWTLAVIGLFTTTRAPLSMEIQEKRLRYFDNSLANFRNLRIPTTTGTPKTRSQKKTLPRALG